MPVGRAARQRTAARRARGRTSIFIERHPVGILAATATVRRLRIGSYLAEVWPRQRSARVALMPTAAQLDTRPSARRAPSVRAISLPPYSLTRSETIARPSPVPGLVSSSRRPRFSASRALSSGMPGPSSSMAMRNIACASSRAATASDMTTARRRPFHRRFRADCRRSPRDPRVRRQRRSSRRRQRQSIVDCRVELVHHPHHAAPAAAPPACGRRRCRAARRCGRAADSARAGCCMAAAWSAISSPLVAAERPRLVEQHGERRLQRMRQVADLRARALDDAPVVLDQRVGLVGQRLDLGGKAAVEPLRRALAHLRQRVAHPAAAAAGRAGWRRR